MKLAKTPRILHRLYPDRIWAMPKTHNKVFLTFDDGPIPEVTPWVLDELKKFNAKATFFCIGDNVRKNPEVFQRVLEEGHSIGNHTFNHLNGWKTDASDYLENIHQAQQAMESLNFSEYSTSETTSKILFRPPYGRITSHQAKAVQQANYKIVMWDIISFDYDASVSEEKCLDNVLSNLQPGSVVVFHDSLKAEKNLRYALPKTLEYLSEQGFEFARL